MTSKPESRQAWHKRSPAIIGLFLCIGLAWVCMRTFAYDLYKNSSTSMAPTFEGKRMLIVQKFGYGRTGGGAAIVRGDVMVFDYPRNPSQAFVMRVVGLPGDRVALRDRRLYINGKDTRVRTLEPYLHEEAPRYAERYRNTLDGKQFDTLLDEGKADLAIAPYDFAFRERCTYTERTLACTVPPGNYFLMGDNRDNSLDSRYWGFVRADAMIGKVVSTL